MNRFSGRVAGLDASRTTLMFFGLVVHASALAASMQPVTSAPTDTASILLSILGHNFRMPAFFMVSGIFSAYLLNTRSLARFATQRRRRLLYPLLAACFTILPLSYWSMVGFSVSFDQVLALGPMHLWFIYYLIWFSAALLLVEWLLRKFDHSLVSAKVRPLGVWLVNPLSVLILAVAITLVPDWFTLTANALANNSSLFPPLGLVLYYVMFFKFGILLYRYWTSAEKWLRRFWPFFIALGLASFAVYANELYGELRHDVLHLSYSITTWMLALGLIGMFLFFVRTERKFVRYLSDSSYWVYLVHYPIMVMLQKWFASLHTGLAVAFVLGVIVDAAISIGLYQWFVKDKFIANFLAGKLASQSEAKKRRK
ncbi:MAG: hypothetical protein RLZZ164_623 [Actinomycetota bacterium]